MNWTFLSFCYKFFEVSSKNFLASKKKGHLNIENIIFIYLIGMDTFL